MLLWVPSVVFLYILLKFKTESIRKLSNFNFQWTTTLYQNNLNHIVLSHCHTVTPYFEGRGIGGGVRENNAFCFLLRLDNLLSFIENGGIWKVTIQPRFNNAPIFPWGRGCQKGTMLKWAYVVMSSVCTGLLSQDSQTKSPLGDSCFSPERRPSDWGRVIGKIKQNELDCFDTAPLISKKRIQQRSEPLIFLLSFV